MGKSSTVDVHAHYFPGAFLRLIADEGAAFGASVTESGGAGPVFDAGPLHAGPMAWRFIDLGERIAAMDAQGVQVQALSLTQPMVYWAEGNLAPKLVRDLQRRARRCPPGVS